MKFALRFISESDFENPRLIFRSSVTHWNSGSTRKHASDHRCGRNFRSETKWKKYSASLFGSTFFGNEKRWKYNYKFLDTFLCWKKYPKTALQFYKELFMLRYSAHKTADTYLASCFFLWSPLHCDKERSFAICTAS